MGHMFDDCKNLEKLKINQNNFITSSVEDMAYMFHDCYQLDSIELSKFEKKK